MAEVTRRELLAARGPKNEVDPRRPYAFLVEQERSAAGQLEDVASELWQDKHLSGLEPARAVDTWLSPIVPQSAPASAP